MSTTGIASSSYAQPAYASPSSMSPAAAAPSPSGGYAADSMGGPSSGADLYGSGGGSAPAAPPKKKHTLLYAVLGTVGLATVIGLAIWAYKANTKKTETPAAGSDDKETGKTEAEKRAEAEAQKVKDSETETHTPEPGKSVTPPNPQNTAPAANGEKQFTTIQEHDDHVAALEAASRAAQAPADNANNVNALKTTRLRAHRALDTAKAALNTHLSERLPLQAAVTAHPRNPELVDTHEHNLTADGHAINLANHDLNHAALVQGVTTAENAFKTADEAVKTAVNTYAEQLKAHNDAHTALENARKAQHAFSEHAASHIPVR